MIPGSGGLILVRLFFSSPHPLNDLSSSFHRPLAIEQEFLRNAVDLMWAQGERPDMKETFVVEKLI